MTKTSTLLVFLLIIPWLQCPAAAEEPAKAELTEQDKVRLQSFMQAMDSVFPLGKKELEDVRKNRDMVEETVTKTPIATITSISRPLLLEPGRIPPPVILTPGYVGAVAFFDSTGAPWPVSRAVIGNNAMFNLVAATSSPAPKEGDAAMIGDAHILYITPMREHANSNILVHLMDSPNPVVIQLISDPSSKSDRRHEGIVNFMVRAHGPNAKQPMFASIRPTINEVMMALLDGTPPEGASLLKTKQAVNGVSLWKINDKMYMRSSHTLRWPAYTAFAESSGTYVYEMTPVPSIMISENGHSVSIILDDSR